MPKFLDAIAGFGVTFGTMFKKPVTEEYPEKPGPVAKRYHGRHQLNRYPDGLEKCIGCELCAGPARPMRSTSRAPTTPRRNAIRPANATAACTRSTTCAASAAGCASRRAPPAR